MQVRITGVQQFLDKNSMQITIDRIADRPENLVGKYVHFTEDPQEVLPSLKVTKAVLNHILSEWEEYSNGQILQAQRESLINTFYHRLSIVEAFNEKQPGELRETKKAIRSQAPATAKKEFIVTGKEYALIRKTFYESMDKYKEKFPPGLYSNVKNLFELKLSKRFSVDESFGEGSETTGEVREEPVLDFSASPLNNQLERPAVKNTRGEDIFTAIITWVAVLLVTCGTLGGLFVFMAWLKAVSISFGY